MRTRHLMGFLAVQLFAACPTPAGPHGLARPATYRSAPARANVASGKSNVRPTEPSGTSEEPSDSETSTDDEDEMEQPSDPPWVRACTNAPRPLDKAARGEVRRLEEALLASMLVEPVEELFDGGPAGVFSVLREYPTMTLALSLPDKVRVPKTPIRVRFATDDDNFKEPTIHVQLDVLGMVGDAEERAVVVDFNFIPAGPNPVPGQIWLFGAGGPYCVRRVEDGRWHTVPIGTHWISQR